MFWFWLIGIPAVGTRRTSVRTRRWVWLPTARRCGLVTDNLWSGVGERGLRKGWRPVGRGRSLGEEGVGWVVGRSLREEGVGRGKQRIMGRKTVPTGPRPCHAVTAILQTIAGAAILG